MKSDITLPKPRLTKFKDNYIQHRGDWFCRSDEFFEDGPIDAFICGGIGSSPEEAYKDWEENYRNDRYLEYEDSEL